MIDALATGLTVVARRIGVVLIPVILDCFYWLGPRVSIAPLMRQIKQLLDLWAQDLPTSQVDQLALLRDLVTRAEEANLFGLLSPGVLGVPHFEGWQKLVPQGATASGVIEVGSWVSFLGLFVLLTMLGWLVGSAYLVLVAQGVREVPWSSGRLIRHILVVWLSIIGLAAVMLTLGVVVMGPLSLTTALVTLINPGMGSLMVGLVWVFSLWIALHLFFTIDALVLEQITPLRAMWNSFNVVRRNFWSALGLILLMTILGRGLALVWEALSVNPAGVLVGITGNALVGTGLVAASLAFYQDRLRRWRQAES